MFESQTARGVEIMSSKLDLLIERIDLDLGDLPSVDERISDYAPSNRIATQSESETLEGIADRIGLDCDAYPSWDLLLSAIHRKLDSMKFELDAYKYLTEAETVDDKEMF